MKIEKALTCVSDTRGKLIEVVRGTAWKQLNHLITKKGCTRGNHYHKNTKELFYILRGKMLIDITNMKSGETYSLKAAKGDMFIIDVYEKHTMQAVTDVECIVLLSDEFNERDPDIFEK